MSFLTVEELQENMGTSKVTYTPLLKDQGPDASAAFARIQILRKTRKHLERDLNDTSLKDITFKMRDMYNSLAVLFDDLIEEEMKQVRDGESW